MRLGKYTILNESTLEVLTKSSEHSIMTLEHITEFVETDTTHYSWLQEDVQKAKDYLDKKSYKDVSSRRFCSVCGIAALEGQGTDTCLNCGLLDENVQRAFIALRSQIIEQQEYIEELRNKTESSAK
jgi:hypothetical protein